MNFFSKQPSEKFTISVDFSNMLDTNENISTLQVKAYTKNAGTDVTSTIIESSTIESQMAYAVIMAGTTNTIYKITFKATTDQNNVYEDDVFMQVEEV
jgi:hypothetical protein